MQQTSLFHRAKQQKRTWSYPRSRLALFGRLAAFTFALALLGARRLLVCTPKRCSTVKC